MIRSKALICVSLLLCLLCLVLASCKEEGTTVTTEPNNTAATTAETTAVSTTAETTAVITTQKTTVITTTKKVTETTTATNTVKTTTTQTTKATTTKATTTKATTTKVTTTTKTPSGVMSYVQVNRSALVYPANSGAAMDVCVSQLFSVLSKTATNITVSSGFSTASRYIQLCEADEFEAKYGYVLGLNDYCILVTDKGIAIGGGGIMGLQNAIKKFGEGLANGNYYYKAKSDVYRYTALPNNDKFTEIMAAYKDENGRLMNVAHRADHQNYPENSIPAIQSCIDAGVDIIELDVMRTKDGKWVLMHDNSVNRTTNGSGNVSSMTLEQIQALYLKEGKGGSGAALTEYHPPSFEEVLRICSGKVIINLDKNANSANYFDEIYELLEKYDCVNIAQFKTSEAPSVVRARFDKLKDQGKELPIYSGMIYSSDYEYTLNRIRELEGLTDMIELGFTRNKDKYSEAEHEENLKNVIATAKECGIRSMVLTLYNDDNAIVWTDWKKLGYNCFMTEHALDLARYIDATEFVTDATDITRAADFVEYSGVSLTDSDFYDVKIHGRALSSVSDGDYVKIPKINFSGNENGIYIAATVSSECTVKVYVDSKSSSGLIGQVSLKPGSSGETLFAGNLTKKVSGVHNVYLAFEGSGNGMAKVEFFSFFSDDGKIATVVNPYLECTKFNIKPPETVTCITSGGRMVETAVTWNLAESYSVGTHSVRGTTASGAAVTLTLKIVDCEKITSVAEWNAFAKNVNNGNTYEGLAIALDADLDFSGASFTVAGTSKDKPFMGTFVGLGHTVKNINFNGSVIAGLFGYTKKADISGIKLQNSTFKTSSGYAAGIVAYGDGSTVSECSVTDCTIRSERSTTDLGGVGGLAGYFENYSGYTATISDCHVTNATIYGKRDVGGLIGDLFTGEIVNSTVTGNTTVTATGNSIGGFAGNVHGGHLEGNYCSAEVSSPGNNIGAFTGYNNGNPTYIDCSYDGSKTTSRDAVGKLASDFNGSITKK